MKIGNQTFLFAEASSVLDSRDVSYLNEPSDQHVRGRRRIESASDIGGSSVYSDDVSLIFVWSGKEETCFVFVYLESICFLSESCKIV